MKASELTGTALDLAVVKCEGFRIEHDYQYTEEAKLNGWWQCGPYCWQPLCEYSSDWAQGGPIIERECIATYASGACSAAPKNPDYWVAEILDASEMITQYGPTPLIAAMRCFVASKLGDDVDIPEELLK